jgi:hypothetical protein
MDTTWFGSYMPSEDPNYRFVALGQPDQYNLSDGSSWRAGAGSTYLGAVRYKDVTVDKGVAIYSFDPVRAPFYAHTEYDDGDHSAQGELGVFTPIALIARIGGSTGLISGYITIISNDPT